MLKLERFLDAQDSPDAGFETALAEIRSGAKRGHWIWYVFPQTAGLGTSSASRMFAIAGAAEAREYIRDSELRSRLVVIAGAVAEQLKRGTPLRVLMGSDVDARKVVSSMTLSAQVARELAETDSTDAYKCLAAVAADVLALAESEGYSPCAFTLDRLRKTS